MDFTRDRWLPLLARREDRGDQQPERKDPHQECAEPSGTRTGAAASESQQQHQAAAARGEPRCRHDPAVWADGVAADPGGGQCTVGSERVQQEKRERKVREAGDGGGAEERGVEAGSGSDVFHILMALRPNEMEISYGRGRWQTRGSLLAMGPLASSVG